MIDKMYKSLEKTMRSRDWVSLLVRVAAVIICILLFVYFILTLNNMVSISNKVDERRTTTYPASVAAGHIETSLSSITTMISGLSALNDFPYNMTRMQYVFQTADTSIRDNIALLAPSTIPEPYNLKDFMDTYDTLADHVQRLLTMCEQVAMTNASVRGYIRVEISPLVEELNIIDLAILNESTDDMEVMYEQVVDATQFTIVLSCVLMAAVFMTIIIYINLLHRKDQQEEKLAKNLGDALNMAQSASAAKSAFLSNMSHDIRTPLNAIIGLTEIARDELGNEEEVERCLDQITTSSHHLLRLINDILDMDKIESGKATLSKDVISLASVMDEIVTITEPQAIAKNLECRFNLNNIQNDNVIGDQTRLKQILLNLISNAIKYTKEGGVISITVDEKRQISANTVVFDFTVSDSGIGMKPEFLEYIFEPFERERNENTKFIEGTGLGMPITKNLVNMMGGTIKVESVYGEGSVFTVHLPFKLATKKQVEEAGLELSAPKEDWDERAAEKAKDAVSAAAGAEAKQDEKAPSPSGESKGAVDPGSSEDGDVQTASESEAKETKDAPAKEKDAKTDDDKVLLKGRVLIVEDNEINMEIADRLVSKWGPEVERASDGLEGSEKVKEAPEGYYDLIFMDWQMPRMNGIDATKEIIKFNKANDRKQIPIVAMTANAFNEDKQQAFEAGMDGFLSKPINSKELEKTLREYLPEQHQ